MKPWEDRKKWKKLIQQGAVPKITGVSSFRGSQETGQPGNFCDKNLLKTDEMQIINLSSYPLSGDQKHVLQLSLSFCPYQNINKFEDIKDVNLFAESLCYM